MQTFNVPPATGKKKEFKTEKLLEKPIMPPLGMKKTVRVKKHNKTHIEITTNR